MDTFLVSEDVKPCSIRNFLAQKGISLTNWRKIKKDGTILVNGLPAPISQRIKPGDMVSFSAPVPVSSVLPEEGPLKIIYEDADLIIVDKPADMLVHPTVKSASHTLSNYLAGYYARTILQLVFILFSAWIAILLGWSSLLKSLLYSTSLLPVLFIKNTWLC